MSNDKYTQNIVNYIQNIPMPQKNIANIMSISPSTLTAILKGNRGIKINSLISLAECFGDSLDKITGYMPTNGIKTPLLTIKDLYTIMPNLQIPVEIIHATTGQILTPLCSLDVIYRKNEDIKNTHILYTTIERTLKEGRLYLRIMTEREVI